jgi:hypothetical protein
LRREVPRNLLRSTVQFYDCTTTVCAGYIPADDNGAGAGPAGIPSLVESGSSVESQGGYAVVLIWKVLSNHAPTTAVSYKTREVAVSSFLSVT